MLEATRVARRTASAQLVVIVNARASGTGDGALLDTVLDGIRSTGARAVAVATRSEEELQRALQEADGRRVVLVGGDGSVHAALNAAADLPELALVPTGRANNVARSLGVPLDPWHAARLAAVGAAAPVDALAVRSGLKSITCLEAVSAGLHAHARSGYRAPNSADVLAGARLFADALWHYRPYPVLLEVDGELVYEGDAAQVFVANLPLFAFGFRVNPSGRPGDGLLEAVVIEAQTRREAVHQLWAAYHGKHVGEPGVTVFRGARAALRWPIPLVGDATPLGTGTADVAVDPARLRVVVPWWL